ncbi:MAG: 2-amino-4-hydroxy-6-hydroxymethyldihydropteridine diphosphokinase [Candidatus Dormibacteria bacterium]
MALGSNVGHRAEALHNLRAALSAAGFQLTGASAEVVTRPCGVVRQRDFLNQVVRLEAGTALPPLEWLRRCQAAESAAGRRPTYRWGPRRADADLLLLGPDGAVRWSDEQLTVPHPALRERAFLAPLLGAAGYTGRRSAS